MLDVVQTPRRSDEVEMAIVEERARNADLIRDFHRLFHASRQTCALSFYQGVPILQNPTDAWVLMEIIWDLQPTLVIETGTAYGGTALLFARTFDALGDGKVISIDLEPDGQAPNHPRIHYVSGLSSVDERVVGAVGTVAATHPRVMVFLDSAHEKAHVLAELNAYALMVTTGQFLVIADTDLNGRPVDAGWQRGPGPGPAVDEWLPRHPEFKRAVMAERYMISSHSWFRRER